MNVEASGEVLLLLAIDRYGVAKKVSVLHSTVSKEIEAQVVLRLFYAKYEPATRGGVTKDGSIVVEVVLDPVAPKSGD
jgi:outer membrane biosynthesis protein TonB